MAETTEHKGKEGTAMNKSLLLCARDIELSYFRGIPLKAAIRQMQYMLVPYEVKAAQRDLRLKQSEKYKLYKSYKGANK
jgi:hypothetical protein